MKNIEEMKEIAETLEALEALFSPNLRIKLEMGFMENTVGAKTEIPLEALMNAKNPKELVEDVLREMHIGIMARLKEQAEEEIAEMEE